MTMIIGAGATRPVHPNQLLGIAEFDETKPYAVGKFVLKGKGFYRFKVAHEANTPWDENEVTAYSTLDLILASIGDPRIKPLDNNIKEGDMAFYDRARGEHCYVPKAMIAAVLADYNDVRYETNYDTYVGTIDGKAHFVARNDAAVLTSAQGGNDVAATACYYRIEIEVGSAGSITFSATTGVGSIASNTISWSASNTLTEIVAMFTAKNNTNAYIAFAKLEDDKGVGLSLGGHTTNKMTVTALSGCTVIDCSALAFLRSQNPAAPAVGGTFNPNAAWTYLRGIPTIANNILGDGQHNGFRNATTRSILGTSLVNASSVCKANDGYDYSYRTGLNYAKFKEWATTSGDDTYYDDGEGGTDQSQGHVMKKSRFDTEVTNYTGSDSHRVGMKTYYDHLLNDQTGDYATLRQQYESWYNSQMTSMYDAYLMSHMMKIDAADGITYSMANKGFAQTVAKADCMNVTYNYVIIPAYPPEYNAQQYGKSASEGFAPGMYYHPEPADLGLMFRDDIMPLINANITASGGGTQLTNSLYRGSSADYPAYPSWFFSGTNGCLGYNSRYNTRFRCRPTLALPLPA